MEEGIPTQESFDFPLIVEANPCHSYAPRFVGEMIVDYGNNCGIPWMCNICKGPVVKKYPRILSSVIAKNPTKISVKTTLSTCRACSNTNQDRLPTPKQRSSIALIISSAPTTEPITTGTTIGASLAILLNIPPRSLSISKPRARCASSVVPKSRVTVGRNRNERSMAYENLSDT